jgi:CheY-like chemotaxis protein
MDRRLKKAKTSWSAQPAVLSHFAYPITSSGIKVGLSVRDTPGGPVPGRLAAERQLATAAAVVPRRVLPESTVASRPLAMPTILLAEDHARTREALRQILALEPDLTIVAEAKDGTEAARLAEELQADVLVCDLMMPGLNGLEVAEKVAKASPKTSVVMISNYTEPPYVQQALKLGVRGFVDKLECSQHLAKAVRASLSGQTYLSPSVSAE